MNQNQVPATTEAIAPAAAIKWLEEAARYFEKQPDNGEDMTHWANVANAENARKIADLIRGAHAAQAAIQKIAEVASAVAWQAGVGGMETAGALVSAFAAHPEKVALFMADKLDLIDDETLLHPEFGCLTWMAMSGKIVGPAEMRAHKQKRDH